MQAWPSCHPFGPPIAVTAERYYEIQVSAAGPKSPKAKSIPGFGYVPIPGHPGSERTPERLTAPHGTGPARTGAPRYWPGALPAPLTAGTEEVTNHELAEPLRHGVQHPAAVAPGHLVHEVG